MKQVKTALGIFTLSSALVLTGCGSGSGSNNGGSGNENSKNLTSTTFGEEKVDSSKTTFSFVNNSGNKIAKAIVKNNSTEIYNDTLICEKTNLCHIKIDNKKVTKDENLTFEFINDKDTITSAYQWKYKTGNKFNIFANDTTLGLHVFHEMKAKYAEDAAAPTLLELELNNLFKNYGNDTFNNLGLYFKHEVSSGHLTEDQFYTELKSELSTKHVLNQDVLPKVNLSQINSLSYNNDPLPIPDLNDICNEPMVNNVLIGLSSITFLITNPIIGGTLSAIMGGANDALMNACTSNIPITDLIDGLTSRMDAVDQKLYELNYNVVDLYSRIAKSGNRANMNDFNNAVVKIGTYTNKFDILLKCSDEDEVGICVPSDNLEIYANKNGGVRSIIEDHRKDILKTLLKTTADQITDFENLMSDEVIGQVAADIKDMCGNPATIPGDILTERGNCLLLTQYVTEKYIDTGKTMETMLKAEIKAVLSVRTPSGQLDKQWLKDNEIYFNSKKDPAIGWEDADAEIDRITSRKLKFVKDTLIGEGDEAFKKLDPLYGFDSELASSMKKRKCLHTVVLEDPITKEKKTFSQPWVLEWYTNISQDRPHIVSRCEDGTTNDGKPNLVDSKYYTNSTNKDVANIMGVLTPNEGNLFWPNQTEGNKININATEISSVRGRTNTTFELYSVMYPDPKKPIYSPYPIRINSTAVRSYKKKELRTPDEYYPSIPDFSFVSADQHGPIYPLYTVPNRAGSFPFHALTFGGNGSVELSNFLKPFKDANDQDSKTNFESVILNAGYDEGVLLSEGAHLVEIIYVSFEKNNHTYVFGIRIGNIGTRWKYNPFLNKTMGTGLINVVCLSNTQCSRDPIRTHGIKWPDGTFAAVHDDGRIGAYGVNKIRLYFGQDEKAN